MKRLLSLLLVLVLVLGAVPMTALAVNPFTDVPQNQWYYADIDSAYQNGLINGKTPTLYMPDDFLTYAEAVKLAAAMNQRYTTGAVTLQNGNPWYQTYVDYCKTKGIIYVDYAWNQNATRAGYMDIFANALPSSAMQEINNIPDGSIPDVPMSHPQADAIYKLYRVGILQGNDLQHNCNPGANIKRSEVAAILTRMMDSSKRIQFSMDTEALRITQNPADVTCDAGEMVSFSVKAEGGKEPYAYKWQWKNSSSNWQTDTGSTSATLQKIFNDTQLQSGLEYRCVVTDADNKSVTSTAAKVTPKTTELKIKTQPVNVSAEVGGTATLSVEVEGGKTPYKYQWYGKERNAGGTQWLMVMGMNAATATTPKLNNAGTMELRCEVTDANGKKVTSNTATVEIKEKIAELKIKTQPEGGTKKPGEKMTPFVEAEGGKQPYTYQWEAENGNNTWIKVPGATAAALNMGIGESAVGEDLIYRCVVTDANGKSVTSDPAVFKIVAAESPLKIKTQPVSAEVQAGGAFVVSVEAEGGKAPYTYQWEARASVATRPMWLKVGENSASLRVLVPSNTEERTVQYRCTVTDAAGNSVTSDVAVIVIKNSAELKITTQPTSVSNAYDGDCPTFSIAVSGGKAPYNFDWEYKGSSGWTDMGGYGYQESSSGNESICQMYAEDNYNIEMRCIVTDANGKTVESAHFYIIPH